MNRYILIIDKEQLLCQGLTRALRHGRVQVDSAPTVVDAMARHNRRDYDLCLLDIKLSDENCLNLIEIIREQWPGMKIILMTTCDISPHEEINEYILRAEKNGASRLLCKPFNLRQLRDVVAHSMEGGQDWPESNGLFSEGLRPRAGG